MIPEPNHETAADRWMGIIEFGLSVLIIPLLVAGMLAFWHLDPTFFPK